MEHVTWLTCAVDGRDHAIPDDHAAGTRGDGRFVALCRATVWASSLAAPPAGRCSSCAAALPDPVRDRTPGRSRSRRFPGL